MPTSEYRRCRDCQWVSRDEDLVAAVPEPGADVEQVCPRCHSDYIKAARYHATPELRYREDVVLGGLDLRHVLQQKWQEEETGRTLWCDVPVSSGDASDG